MHDDPASAPGSDDDGGDSVDTPSPIRCGANELRRVLSELTDDVHALDGDAFRAWLARQLARWQRDPVFRLRCEIRDVRRAHPDIRRLERAVRHARLLDDESPEHAELARLEKAIDDATKAIDGLTAAADHASAEARERLLAKRAGFVERRSADRTELERLTARSPARRRLNRITAKLDRLHDEAGLPELESRLEGLHRERGRRSTEGGGQFEEVAAAVVRTQVVPRLAAEVGALPVDRSFSRDALGSAADGAIRILRGVTLGAAGTEIDQLVALVPSSEIEPVDVLALVEAKRDINDVARGFRQRQQNLAWLTGDAAAYDPEAFRTRAFPTGHFDRAAVHEQAGERFTIARTSFRRFRRDERTGWFIDRLWFITRPGTLWGAGRAAMSRLAHRASTDESFDADDGTYMDALRRWFLGMTDAVETPDVLRTYAAEETRAEQVLLVGD